MPNSQYETFNAVFRQGYILDRFDPYFTCLTVLGSLDQIWTTMNEKLEVTDKFW